MKVEFNGHYYRLVNRIGYSACIGCAVYEDSHLSCPINAKRECILPLNKIYIATNFLPIFKL